MLRLSKKVISKSVCLDLNYIRLFEEAYGEGLTETDDAHAKKLIKNIQKDIERSSYRIRNKLEFLEDYLSR